MHDGFQFTAASNYGVKLCELFRMSCSIASIMFIPDVKGKPIVSIQPALGKTLKHYRQIWLRPFICDGADLIQEQIIHYDDTRIAIDIPNGVVKVQNV